MFHLGSHIWTVIVSVFIFIMAFFIWFFGYWNLQDNLASDNLSDAVRTATYMSKDNSSRLERGSFIINTDKFKDELGKDHIKAFNGRALTPNDYHVDYLTDNQNGRDNGNDHNVSKSDQSRNVTTNTPAVSNHDNGKYRTIRGVRVSVNYPARSKLVNGGKNDNYKGDRFTATDIIQTYGKSNKHDTYNDLTR